ncbi:hypothetical protein NE237_009152 [Protea cynaroides]|uniref:Uncharacterized protein n=1 Tax=Protea cynaroides TaxID=273540 RepID=A0A9Q0R0C6_9MAGN|nr:hypothetical protein NE237_009152 [Protea cynaroides]
MVQRPAPEKLGILADSKNYVKSKKWLLALKASSQHQYIQVKDGTGFKRKEMKKLRSIKLLDLENLEPPPTRQPKSSFHKLPTNASSSAAVARPVPSMIKKQDPSPNFMTPTSSSDAKERSQVSPHGYQASSPFKSSSPKPRGRNSNRMNSSPRPNGRTVNRKSPSPIPSRRTSHCNNPSERNSYRMNLSPTPIGRNSHGNSLPNPSGRSSYHMSPISLRQSARYSYHNSSSPTPSGRNSHCKTPNTCPSGRNSDCMSLSPCASGRTPNRSPSPSPTGRSPHGKSLNSSLSRSTSDYKLCSASGHKPVKTSTKTSCLKPVRTLTKTPSFKGGGTKLKKQIKKSRSMKLLDFESLESSVMQQIKFSFDESPGNVSSAAVTLQEQSLIKTPYLLPNYMKSTSSSDQRKEHLQVNKSPNESNLIHIKPSTASGHKQSRPQKKTSSLKPVRTLLKTSSLKSVRPSMKKNSDIALCSSPNADRATCSELERISPMKVYPYTYCSLNGHCHTPLPQLKHFLSTMRHFLKTQKSLKLNIYLYLGKRDGIDVFVETYAKPREDSAMPIGRSIQDGNDEATILDIITSSAQDKPDDLSYSNISLESNTPKNSNPVAEMDVATSQHDQFIQGQYANNQSMFTADTKLDESSIEATDVDRKEGQGVAPPTDDEPNLIVYLPESKSPELQEELVSKPHDIVNNSEEFPAAGLIQKQVHTENDESFNKECGYHHPKTDAEDQSFYPSVPSNVSGEESDTSYCPDANLFSSSEIAFEEPTTIMEERDGAPKQDETFNSMAHSASTEDPLEEFTASIDEKDEELQPENFFLEQPEPIPIADVAVDALVNKQESNSLTFTNNLLGTDVGGDVEEEKQAEDSVEHDDHGEKSSQAENTIEEEETIQVEDDMESDATETIHRADNITGSKEDKKIVNKENNSNQQLLMTSANLKTTMRGRRLIEDQEEQRKFNPREPQYLDIVPEPVPEKRKVSLLVEAFKTDIPPPKFETHLPNTSATFAHARPIQACN